MQWVRCMNNKELRQTLERYGYSERHISRMILFNGGSNET